MSHSAYTASERRGVILIALIALLLILLGVGFSLWNKERVNNNVIPKVEEYPEYIDSADFKEAPIIKPETKKQKSKKNSEKKKYRRRSPLDEPV